SSSIYSKFQSLSLCTLNPQFPDKKENSDFPSKSKQGRYSSNFDLDLESSWLLDDISLMSNPMAMPPYPFSTSSDQPSSPLWGFSDVEDDRHVRVAPSTLSDSYKIFSCIYSFHGFASQFVLVLKFTEI
ncbi:hypothetical protein Lal_00000414, partial [Lupinus albus]